MPALAPVGVVLGGGFDLQRFLDEIDILNQSLTQGQDFGVVALRKTDHEHRIAPEVENEASHSETA
jgi:hypothetical protein